MASSSKVMFKLETLREKAIESINLRIAQQQLEVDSFDDDDALAQRIDAWRVRQHDKLREAVRRIDADDMDDHRLSKFSLDSIPEVDRWDRSRAQQKLRELESRKSQILAKSESLVPDEDGNISLTKLQLQEFFGL